MPIYDYETVHEPIRKPKGARLRATANLVLAVFGVAFLLAFVVPFILIGVDIYFESEWRLAFEPVREAATIPFAMLFALISTLLSELA